ncbi:hypothetical protein D3C72_861940 [compost metagenome]
MKVAVKQLTVQLQRLVNALKKFYFRRTDNAIRLRQVGQEAGNCALCFEGQGGELFLQACQRRWLLDLDPQVRFETFAMSNAQMAP